MQPRPGRSRSSSAARPRSSTPHSGSRGHSGPTHTARGPSRSWPSGGHYARGCGASRRWRQIRQGRAAAPRRCGARRPGPQSLHCERSFGPWPYARFPFAVWSRGSRPAARRPARLGSGWSGPGRVGAVGSRVACGPGGPDARSGGPQRRTRLHQLGASAGKWIMTSSVGAAPCCARDMQNVARHARHASEEVPPTHILFERLRTPSVAA